MHSPEKQRGNSKEWGWEMDGRINERPGEHRSAVEHFRGTYRTLWTPNTAEIKDSGKEKKEVGHPKDVPSETEGSWHLFLLSSFSQDPGVCTSMAVCLSALTVLQGTPVVHWSRAATSLCLLLPEIWCWDSHCFPRSGKKEMCRWLGQSLCKSLLFQSWHPCRFPPTQLVMPFQVISTYVLAVCWPTQYRTLGQSIQYLKTVMACVYCHPSRQGEQPFCDSRRHIYFIFIPAVRSLFALTSR